MLIGFNKAKEITVPGMNNGTGTMTAKMYMDEQGKIISCAIHKGGSIGLHKHETGDDINYVLSGTGKAICDGQEELLSAGTCHICKKVRNTVLRISEMRTWFCLQLWWNDNSVFVRKR